MRLQGRFRADRVEYAMRREARERPLAPTGGRQAPRGRSRRVSTARLAVKGGDRPRSAGKTARRYRDAVRAAEQRELPALQPVAQQHPACGIQTVRQEQDSFCRDGPFEYDKFAHDVFMQEPGNTDLRPMRRFDLSRILEN